MITVKKATSSDETLVLEFIRKQAAFDRQVGSFQGTLEASAERIGRALFGTPAFAHAYLAMAGTMPVGMAFFQYRFSAFQGRPSLWIESVFVDAGARRGGAGVALLKALAQEARLYDCTHLAWHSDARNAPAAAFFLRLGATISSQQGHLSVYSIVPGSLAARIQEIQSAKQPAASAPPFAASAPENNQPGSAVPFAANIPIYRTLLAADTYRDGGSIEVRFSCADGSFQTIWLQVALDPEFEVSYIHTNLLVYADANRQGACRRIGKKSPEEEAIVSGIRRFLRHPRVAVPFADRTPDEQFLAILRALLLSIPARIPIAVEEEAAQGF